MVVDPNADLVTALVTVAQPLADIMAFISGLLASVVVAVGLRA